MFEELMWWVENYNPHIDGKYIPFLSTFFEKRRWVDKPKPREHTGPVAATEWQKDMQVARVANQGENRKIWGEAAYLLEFFEEGEKTWPQLLAFAERRGRVDQLKGDLETIGAEREGNFFRRKPVDRY
jgi:hypothetical protein